MDKKTIEKIYSENAGNVYRYCYYWVKSKEEAEDLVSESFIRLYQSDKADEISNYKAWLFRVSRNMMINKYKSNAVTKRNDIGDDAIEGYDFDHKTLEQTVVDEILVDDIKERIADLDQDTQDIITLKIWEDMTFEEIAEIVEMNTDAVKKRFYRGVEELKTQIAKSQKTNLGIVSIPVLLSGILALSIQPAYAMTAASSAAIVGSISSTLGFTFTNMAISNMTGAAAGSAVGAGAASLSTGASIATGGLLATTAAKVIAGSALLVGGAGVGLGIVSITTPETNNEPEQVQEEIPDNADPATGGITNTKVTVTLKYPQYPDDSQYSERINLFVPSNSTVDDSSGRAIIKGENFQLEVQIPYESHTFIMKEVVEVGNSISFETLYRGKGYDESFALNNPDRWSYTNDPATVDPNRCASEGISVPDVTCGSASLKTVSDNFATLSTYCISDNAEGLSECDRIVKNIEYSIASAEENNDDNLVYGNVELVQPRYANNEAASFLMYDFYQNILNKNFDRAYEISSKRISKEQFINLYKDITDVKVGYIKELDKTRFEAQIILQENNTVGVYKVNILMDANYDANIGQPKDPAYVIRESSSTPYSGTYSLECSKFRDTDYDACYVRDRQTGDLMYLGYDFSGSEPLFLKGKQLGDSQYLITTYSDSAYLGELVYAYNTYDHTLHFMDTFEFLATTSEGNNPLLNDVGVKPECAGKDIMNLETYYSECLSEYSNTDWFKDNVYYLTNSVKYK